MKGETSSTRRTKVVPCTKTTCIPIIDTVRIDVRQDHHLRQQSKTIEQMLLQRLAGMNVCILNGQYRVGQATVYPSRESAPCGPE
jgi:hypothetical protein